MKHGCNPVELQKVLTYLSAEQELPPQYKDHLLKNSRNYQGMRECHIEPDWLLIYWKGEEHIELQRTGTHSDLF